VDLYDLPDGRLGVRWKGLPLPYRIFAKDQRVSHTAIVENKRLGHALAMIKLQQDIKYAPKVKTNSEKNGYRCYRKSTYGKDSCWIVTLRPGLCGLSFHREVAF
jgi:hypothetical protein